MQKKSSEIIHLILPILTIALFLISCDVIKNPEQKVVLPDPVKNLSINITGREGPSTNIFINWQTEYTENSDTDFIIEYLKDVNIDLKNFNDELQKLDWSNPNRLSYNNNELDITANIPDNTVYYYINISNTKIDITTQTNVFRVAREKNGLISEYKYIPLGTDQAKPPGDININDSYSDPYQITIIWSSPNNAGTTYNGGTASITGYKISWKKSTVKVYNNFIVKTNSINSESISTSITNLEPGTTYNIKIQAGNNAYYDTNFFYNTGTGINITTANEITDITNITFTNWKIEQSNVSFTLRWDPLTDTSKSGFTTTVFVSNSYYHPFKGEGEDNFMEITSLKPNENYTVWITTSNNYQNNVYDKKTNILTPSAPGPIPVDSFSVKTTNTNSISLTWEAPKDNGTNPDGTKADLTGYLLSYFSSSASSIWPNITNIGGSGIRLSSEIGTNTSATVEGLAAGTNYTFKVQAVNPYGAGPGTELSVSTTKDNAAFIKND